MGNAKVGVLKTEPQQVVSDYARVLDAIDYRETIKPEIQTLIKLNLSWSLYFPSCSSEPWQVEGVIKKLTQDKFAKIIPVENETVVTNPRKGSSLNKWDGVFEKYSTPFVPLNEVEWVNYKARGEMLALYEIFGEEGHQIPKMFMGKNVVHMPTVKCHGHTTTTGAMKNAFGGLITKKRHHCHKKIHEVLVDLLTIQKEIHPGILAVMDGTVCGNGAGPRTMIPVDKGYILASSDQVAIDAISASMMGFDPLKIEYIKIAHDRGLGIGDLDQIEIVGENEEEIKKTDFGFSTGKSPVIFWDQMLRKGKLSAVEPYLFHGPLFNLCIFGSETYHDKLWYPVKGAKIIEEFSKTRWGKLFNEYK